MASLSLVQIDRTARMANLSLSLPLCIPGYAPILEWKAFEGLLFFSHAKTERQSFLFSPLRPVCALSRGSRVEYIDNRASCAGTGYLCRHVFSIPPIACLLFEAKSNWLGSRNSFLLSSGTGWNDGYWFWGKKKWLKMGISNGGLSSFARIVHRAEGRYRRESRLACTIFLNFAGGGRGDR